jgi:hypothetical protein
MTDHPHDLDTICRDCQEAVDEAEQAAENARHDAMDQILCGADFGQIIRLCTWFLGSVVAEVEDREAMVKGIVEEIVDVVEAFDEVEAGDEQGDPSDDPDDADPTPAVH